MLKFLSLLLPGTFLLMTIPVMAWATHSLDDIRATAVDYVRANLAGEAGDAQISAKQLDPRLKLAHCEQPLQAHTPYSRQSGRKTIVAVRCEGTQPWSLHVPVTIQLYREVVVASRPLARGTVLSAGDLDIQRLDIGQLSGGYVSDPDNIIGLVSTRPLQIGRPILSSMLKAATIIRRGQTITLLARQSSFEVRSSGESLMDGAVGERIKVRNSRSKRVIEGVIAKDGVVFVN